MFWPEVAAYKKMPISRHFCGLDRTRTCDLTDVNGAF